MKAVDYVSLGAFAFIKGMQNVSQNLIGVRNVLSVERETLLAMRTIYRAFHAVAAPSLLGGARFNVMA